MENSEQKVVDNILKIRVSQGLTKRAMAEGMEISEGAYARIESGQIALSYKHLARAASIFGMDVIDVITYPDRYIKAIASDEPVEAILQIKLKKDKKDQVLKLVFGENNIEILNK